MPTYFLDSSALIKRYIVESGAAWVKSECNPIAGNQILIARITRVEMLSAVAKAHRQQIIDQSQMYLTANIILRDIKQQYQMVSLDSATYKRAGELVLQHAARGLRAYDAIQLACAISANRQLLKKTKFKLAFVTADTTLAAVAATTGLLTIDPSNKP